MKFVDVNKLVIAPTNCPITAFIQLNPVTVVIFLILIYKRPFHHIGAVKVYINPANIPISIPQASVSKNNPKILLDTISDVKDKVLVDTIEQSY